MSVNLIKELREITGAGMLDCKKALEASDNSIDAAIDYLREKGLSKAAKKSSRIAAEGLAEIIVDGSKAIIFEVNSETDFVAKNEEFQNLVNLIGTTTLKSGVKSVTEALELDVNGETLANVINGKIATIGENINFRRFEVIEKSETQNFGAYIHMGGKIASLVLVEGANEEVAKDVAMHLAAMNPTYLERSVVPSGDLEKEREVLTAEAMNEGKSKEIAMKMVEGRISKFYKENCLVEQPFIKNSDVTVLEYVKNNGGNVLAMYRYAVGQGIVKAEDNFAEEVARQMNEF